MNFINSRLVHGLIATLFAVTGTSFTEDAEARGSSTSTSSGGRATSSPTSTASRAATTSAATRAAATSQAQNAARSAAAKASLAAGARAGTTAQASRHIMGQSQGYRSGVTQIPGTQASTYARPSFDMSARPYVMSSTIPSQGKAASTPATPSKAGEPSVDKGGAGGRSGVGGGGTGGNGGGHDGGDKNYKNGRGGSGDDGGSKYSRSNFASRGTDTMYQQNIFPYYYYYGSSAHASAEPQRVDDDLQRCIRKTLNGQMLVSDDELSSRSREIWRLRDRFMKTPDARASDDESRFTQQVETAVRACRP